MTSMTARGTGPRGGARSPPELAGANTFRLAVSASLVLFLTILLLLCIHIVPNDQFMFLSGCDTYWIFFMSDNRTQQYPRFDGGQGERPHANAGLNGPCPGNATNNQVCPIRCHCQFHNISASMITMPAGPQSQEQCTVFFHTLTRSEARPWTASSLGR
ncbi:hypothetical protein BGW80DRAFT_1411716 [Lactifluus volemus]|nr:hypothetical protein BGW80DRAFT_1411716 [Lactifluus volemus]